MEILGLYYYWVFAILLMTGFYIVIAKLNLVKKTAGPDTFPVGCFFALHHHGQGRRRYRSHFHCR